MSTHHLDPDLGDAVLHITSLRRWEDQTRAGNTDYHDRSLSTEGYIHCSTVDQVAIPANERFRGHQDLVLLVVAVGRLGPELVYEDSYGTGTEFPHVYGPLNLDAVVDVVPFPADTDGTFRVPVDLADRIEAALGRA